MNHALVSANGPRLGGNDGSPVDGAGARSKHAGSRLCLPPRRRRSH